ncbi:hypothetical protein AVEN_75608-1 [Araneus ventricosus]|uniref:Uncharacterized protein n=1 Tax=Araneus ventricosus TaxID=182803 RepID=A0A4Y2CL55_ARAVE|nr:hypothetical protein AVEN_75608-1 [Araneus ventricosus]
MSGMDRDDHYFRPLPRRRSYLDFRQNVVNTFACFSIVPFCLPADSCSRLFVWLLGTGMYAGIPSCVAFLASSSAASLPRVYDVSSNPSKFGVGRFQ